MFFEPEVENERKKAVLQILGTMVSLGRLITIHKSIFCFLICMFFGNKPKDHAGADFWED